MVKSLDKIWSMDKKDIKVLLNKHQNQTERYTGSLKEDFDHELDAVLECVSGVPEMKKRLDLTFDNVKELQLDMKTVQRELGTVQQDLGDVKHTADLTFDKVGEVAEKVEIVAEAVKNQEQRLQKVEARQ